MVKKKRMNRVVLDLKNISILLMCLGGFLIVVSLMNSFTGYSIYDPYISGSGVKVALWNYTSSDEYTYNASINFSSGAVTLKKLPDYIQSLTVDFNGDKDSGKVNVSNDELKISVNNGSYYSSANYISGIYDSGLDNADWNNFILNDSLNNQSISIYYRLGNTADLTSLPWVSIADGGNVTDNGRYFQYKIEMVSDGNLTPVVYDLTLTSGYTSGSVYTKTFSPSMLDSFIAFYAKDSGSGVSYYYDNGNGWVGLSSGADLTGLNGSSIRIMATLTPGETIPSSYGFNITYNASNSAPVLSSIGAKTLTEGKEFYLDTDATDVDGDTLTFSDTTDLFDINSTHGIINFTPDDEGNYTFNISVSDGISEDVEIVTWEIEENTSGDDDEDEEDTNEEKKNEVKSGTKKVSDTSSEVTDTVVDNEPFVEPASNESDVVTLENLENNKKSRFSNLLTGFGFVTGNMDPRASGAILVGFILIGGIASYYLFYVKGYFVNKEDSGKITGLLSRFGSRRSFLNKKNKQFKKFKKD